MKWSSNGSIWNCSIRTIQSKSRIVFYVKSTIFFSYFRKLFASMLPHRWVLGVCWNQIDRSICPSACSWTINRSHRTSTLHLWSGFESDENETSRTYRRWRECVRFNRQWDADGCVQGRQFSPVRRRSGAEVNSTYATPRNSRRNLEANSHRSICSCRITVDRSINQLQCIIAIVASETQLNQAHNLLKKTFCLAGDDLIFVHQHLLFLKTLRNSLGHFEKLLQTVGHAGVLENPSRMSFVKVNHFRKRTSEAVVVRPVKSLMQSLKHTSAIRLYSRRNSRN